MLINQHYANLQNQCTTCFLFFSFLFCIQAWIKMSRFEVQKKKNNIAFSRCFATSIIKTNSKLISVVHDYSLPLRMEKKVFTNLGVTSYLVQKELEMRTKLLHWFKVKKFDCSLKCTLCFWTEAAPKSEKNLKVSFSTLEWKLFVPLLTECYDLLL